MRHRRVARLLLVLQGVAVAVPVPSLADWNFSGSNTVRVDSYRIRGDERHSPYGQEGTFITNDIDLSLSGDLAPGQTLKFDFAGTVTDSPYRSDHTGLVPEAMRLSYDNATAGLPFRVDLGDQNVQFSELTLNRTLKAARLTVRPNSGSDGRSYWASTVIGSDGQQWRDFDPEENLYYGLSVGMQDQRLGTYSFNLVHHSESGLEGLPSLSQWAASLTGQRQFDIAGQDLNVRGELAYLHGDSAATRHLSAGERPDSGYGVYVQIDGRSQSRPVDYRLRYDRYSDGLGPGGSSALAGSEALLLEGGWRSERDVELRGRLQRSRTELGSANPITTDSAAVSLSGPLIPGDRQKVRGRLDLSRQQRESADDSVSVLAQTAQGSLTITHGARHQTRLNGAIGTVDDRGQSGVERTTRQLAVAHTARIDLAGIDLTITPGVSATEIETEDAEMTVGPTLAIEATRDRERLILELGQSRIDAADPEADVELSRLGLRYEIQRGRHAFGVDIDRSLREPEAGEETDSWHAGMYWRYDFGKDANGVS